MPAPHLDEFDPRCIIIGTPRGNPKRPEAVPMGYAKLAGVGGKPQFQLVRGDPRLSQMDIDPSVRVKLLQQLPFVRSNFHLKPPDPSKPPSNQRTIMLGLTEEIITNMAPVDGYVKEIIASHPQWLKDGATRQMAMDNYCDVVSTYPKKIPLEERTIVLRCKFDIQTTKIAVQNPDGSFRPGTAADLTMEARVMPALNVNGIFTSGNESGLILMITGMYVFPPAEEVGLDALNGDDMGFKMDTSTDYGDVAAGFGGAAAGASDGASDPFGHVPAPAAEPQQLFGQGPASHVSDPPITDKTVIGAVPAWDGETPKSRPMF